jgi:hypothetical protein
LPNSAAAAIVVMRRGRDDFAGSGFGHKRYFDDRQYYSWRGKEIPSTAFEIAVTALPLTAEERLHLVTKDDPSPVSGGPDGPNGWMVLFRSDDPTVWNTDSADERRFAVPAARAPLGVRYLRLRRMDTGDMLIVPVRHGQLTQPPKMTSDGDFVWNGTASADFGGRHLGIAERRPLPGPPPKGHPKKEPPRKGPPSRGSAGR